MPSLRSVTVGHTIFMISSGKGSLCYIRDFAHHPILLLEKPYAEFAYDTDPKQRARRRLKMLTMLVENRTRLLAYHFAGQVSATSPSRATDSITISKEWRSGLV
jgi:hypothetical protein